MLGSALDTLTGVGGTALAFLWAAFAVLGWLLYFHERERSRDYATDLSQLIHDHNLDEGDLRRSRTHDEIQKCLDRWSK